MSQYALNNVTTADQYSAATTLDCVGTKRARIEVANAAIYANYKSVIGLGLGDPWNVNEVFLTPGVHPITQPTSGVRVRSATAGTPAQVTVYAYG